MSDAIGKAKTELADAIMDSGAIISEDDIDIVVGCVSSLIRAHLAAQKSEPVKVRPLNQPTGQFVGPGLVEQKPEPVKGGEFFEAVEALMRRWEEDETFDDTDFRGGVFLAYQDVLKRRARG